MVDLDKVFHVSRLYRLGDEGALKAFCDITVGGRLVVTGVKVVEGKNGLFVSMPRRQGADGKWRDTVFPISRDVRDDLNQTVMTAYKENHDG